MFSALHMQFFGFFPRMLLGLLFGYIFYWSKSLWLPILGHFINNGTVVVMAFLYPEFLNDSDDIFSGDNMSALYYIGSLIVSMTILFLIWKTNQDSSHSVST